MLFDRECSPDIDRAPFAAACLFLKAEAVVRVDFCCVNGFRLVIPELNQLIENVYTLVAQMLETRKEKQNNVGVGCCNMCLQFPLNQRCRRLGIRPLSKRNSRDLQYGL